MEAKPLEIVDCEALPHQAGGGSNSEPTGQCRTRHKCDECNFVSYHLFNLNRHKLIHTRERPFKCNICDSTFTQVSSLKKHKHIHTREKTYKCLFCSCTFHRSSYLKSHEHIHTVEENPYKCNICKYACKKSSTLKIHERIHKGEDPYKCNICDYSCKKLWNLKTHQLVHNYKNPDKCNNICKQLSNLKTHEQIHTEENSYKYNICNYASKKSGALEALKRFHTGGNPHKCCNCVCNRFSHLIKHEHIPIKENPNKCNFDNYAFNHLGTLKTYERFHTSEKLSSEQTLGTLHRCIDCNYYTKSVSRLQYHLTQHKA